MQLVISKQNLIFTFDLNSIGRLYNIFFFSVFFTNIEHYTFSMFVPKDYNHLISKYCAGVMTYEDYAIKTGKVGIKSSHLENKAWKVLDPTAKAKNISRS